jgi:hypothetical protein
MAVNENTRHDNRNTLYLAISGSGKSQALFQNPDIPDRGARVLLYDPNRDHRAARFVSLIEYAKAVKAAIQSGRGFRLAYTGATGPADFDRWCRIVWAALDGWHETYVIAEELSAVCPSSAKASPEAARLLNQGRKYGMRFHGTSQKPQEVAKTFYDQCEIFYLGRQRGNTARKLENDFGLEAGALAALEPLQFWRVSDREGAPKKLQLQYKEQQK